MLELLTNPWIIFLNAFLAGVFTKLADLVVEHGYEAKETKKILLGILWGLFASLAALGSELVAAFYFGILLSWVARYKLDYYNHGIGAAMVFVSIYIIHPIGLLNYLLIAGSFLLFTAFGLLSRELKLKKKMNWFHEYNIYSFIYLVVLAYFWPSVWLVFIASLSNVIGYHGIKKIMQH